MKQISNWDDLKDVEFDGMYFVDLSYIIALLNKDDKPIISINKSSTTIKQAVELLKIYGFEIEYVKPTKYSEGDKLIIKALIELGKTGCEIYREIDGYVHWYVKSNDTGCPESGRLPKNCFESLKDGDFIIISKNNN